MSYMSCMSTHYISVFLLFKFCIETENVDYSVLTLT